MGRKQRRDRLSAIAIIAIILLLIVNAFLLYDKFNRDKMLAKQSSELVEANSLKNDLEKEYYEAIEELDELKTDNEELNAFIDEQKEKLRNQRSQIDDLLVVERNYAKARSEIEALKNNVDKYLKETSQLKAENERLNRQNQSLSSINANLSDSITSVSSRNENLKEEKDDLLSTTQELKNQKEQLSKKVNIASIIKADELKAESYKLSNSGKLRQRSKAKNVELIQVCFKTSENLVADEGQETFHLRIINVAGETLVNEDMGSGIITSSANNKPIRYTRAQTIDYKNQPQNVCFDWKPTNGFMEGTYEVEIYNKGYRCGKTTITLK